MNVMKKRKRKKEEKKKNNTAFKFSGRPHRHLLLRHTRQG
jgi:hypothetical protein